MHLECRNNLRTAECQLKCFTRGCSNLGMPGFPPTLQPVRLPLLVSQLISPHLGTQPYIWSDQEPGATAAQPVRPRISVSPCSRSRPRFWCHGRSTVLRRSRCHSNAAGHARNSGVTAVQPFCGGLGVPAMQPENQGSQGHNRGAIRGANACMTHERSEAENVGSMLL